MNRIGILFVDEFEVVIRIYDIGECGSTSLFDTKSYDLVPLEGSGRPTAEEIVEIFRWAAGLELSRSVGNWKVIARRVADGTAEEISRILRLPVENLTLVREQELICKGLLSEFEPITYKSY